MDDDLEAIRDAWDKNTGDGRDDSRTRELVDAYVEDNPEKFLALQNVTLEQCVSAIDLFRDDPDNSFTPVLKVALFGDSDVDLETCQWLVEVWLLHKWDPQNIGGVAAPTVRVPGSA